MKILGVSALYHDSAAALVVGYAAFFDDDPPPMNHSVQLLGISNAIVDILAHVDDDFLEQIGAVPGSMTLIDMDRAREIYAQMGPATEMSGGSVANTIAGFANLGGSGAYIGRVKAEQLAVHSVPFDAAEAGLCREQVAVLVEAEIHGVAAGAEPFESLAVALPCRSARRQERGRRRRAHRAIAR